jgi:hypothetical protein
MFDDALTMASGFGTGTVTSTNKIDMGTADGDELNPPRVVLHITGPTSAGSNTGVITLVLQDSADNSTFATILTGKVSTANAADMNPYSFFVPPKHRRYLRAQYVVATQAFTAGALSCGIV